MVNRKLINNIYLKYYNNQIFITVLKKKALYALNFYLNETGYFFINDVTMCLFKKNKMFFRSQWN